MTKPSAKFAALPDFCNVGVLVGHQLYRVHGQEWMAKIVRLEQHPLGGLRVIELVVLPRTEVLLFVVPATTDPRPTLPSDTDCKLFRKACGPLVVYELTPLDEPHGLQCLAERH